MFEWFDFLDLAETLAETPNNEAAARTAISRAYYATFTPGVLTFRGRILPSTAAAMRISRC